MIRIQDIADKIAKMDWNFEPGDIIKINGIEGKIVNADAIYNSFGCNWNLTIEYDTEKDETSGLFGMEENKSGDCK